MVHLTKYLAKLHVYRGEKPELVQAVSLATVTSYESWTVREHQNQKCACGYRALILLILLASSYR